MVAMGLTSCLGSSNDSETVVTDYYNCIVTSFSLEDNTNVCSGLSKYSFTIDNYGLSDDSIHALYPNDGIIFNPDSLPRGVIADSVKISVSFSKPDSVYLELFGLDGEASITAPREVKERFLAQLKKLVVSVFRPKGANRIFEIGRLANRSFGGFLIGKLIDNV